MKGVMPKFDLAMKGNFRFIGGPKDGQTEGVPLSWLRCTVSGTVYNVAILEVEKTEANRTGFEYVLVHKSLMPRER